MKTKNIIKTLALLLVSGSMLVACSESEVDTWTAKSSVWFTTNLDETVSFGLFPDSASYVLRIPVTMAGPTASHDRAINATIIGHAINGAQAEVLSESVIPADSTKGYVALRIYNSDALDQGVDTIGLVIGESADLEIGLPEYLQKKVVVSRHLMEPDWWNASSKYPMGRFTEKKLLIVYQVLGSIDNPFTDTMFMANVNYYRLKHYLEVYGPFYDNDGMEIRFEENF